MLFCQLKVTNQVFYVVIKYVNFLLHTAVKIYCDICECKIIVSQGFFIKIMTILSHFRTTVLYLSTEIKLVHATGYLYN